MEHHIQQLQITQFFSSAHGSFTKKDSAGPQTRSQQISKDWNHKELYFSHHEIKLEINGKISLHNLKMFVSWTQL